MTRLNPTWALLSLTVLLGSSPARADEPKEPERTWSSCVEHIPEGASRPLMVEVFPQRGFSGYAQTLTVTVTHGKGETVLPEGFKVSRGSDAERALEASGFVLPQSAGGSGPSVSTEESETASTTKVEIPIVTLPKEPGRNRMMLPPLPIAVARASGEIVTVCTRPHPILVEDPITNEADPKVKPNPEGRSQREEWVLAKQLTVGALVGVALGLLIALLVRRWMKRPKVVVVPPPRPPWEVALETLASIRRSDLLEDDKTDAYFDAVSDCVRKYLGDRYGFDGLESTTDEMRATLKRVRPKVRDLTKISEFLADCDLVKFARMVPSEADCLGALDIGEQIVRRTTPRPAKKKVEDSPDEDEGSEAA